ncbi:hypothetical protein, partial [Paraburkholderia silvatlantica]
SSFSLPCPTAAPPTCWRNADGKRAELFRTDYERSVCAGQPLDGAQGFKQSVKRPGHQAVSLGKRRSSCFKSRTTYLIAGAAANAPDVKKSQRGQNFASRSTPNKSKFCPCKLDENQTNDIELAD